MSTMRMSPKKIAAGFDREKLADMLFGGVHQLSINLSQKQFGQLLDYLALLHKWNGVYNLTAVREPKSMVIQHILDSLAVLPAFAESDHVLDVGSGGGLPGMVLAISRPELKVELIDAVQKKTAFLKQVKAELDLQNVSVRAGRVEELRASQPFDAITSRAFSSLKDMIELSEHLLAPDGKFLAMKGIMHNEEMAEIPTGWKVREVKKIEVPGLKAERHLVIMERDVQ